MDAARDLFYEERITKKEYTHEDILSLPEGRRAEIIDGVWYDMATPNYRHQKILAALERKLWEYIEKKGGECEVLFAPFALFLTESKRNWLEPDIMVVCDRDKIKDDGCHGAPDLVIEITSPSTVKKDMGVKLFKYRTEGVGEYWIVNPDKELTTVYNFDENIDKIGGELIGFDEELVSSLYTDFSICLKEYL